MVSCLRKNLLVKNTHLTQKIEENLGQSADAAAKIRKSEEKQSKTKGN